MNNSSDQNQNQQQQQSQQQQQQQQLLNNLQMFMPTNLQMSQNQSGQNIEPFLNNQNGQTGEGNPANEQLYAEHLKKLNEKFIETKEDIIQLPKDPDVFKNHQLPLARVKKIMKSDEDVRMISAEAPVLFAKACEMFIIELTHRAWLFTEEGKRRTLQKNDIAACIQNTEIFDFLIDIIPKEEFKMQNMQQGQQPKQMQEQQNFMNQYGMGQGLGNFPQPQMAFAQQFQQQILNFQKSQQQDFNNQMSQGNNSNSQNNQDFNQFQQMYNNNSNNNQQQQNQKD